MSLNVGSFNGNNITGVMQFWAGKAKKAGMKLAMAVSGIGRDVAEATNKVASTADRYKSEVLHWEPILTELDQAANIFLDKGLSETLGLGKKSEPGSNVNEVVDGATPNPEEPRTGGTR